MQPADFSSFFPPALTIFALLRNQDFFLSCEQCSKFLLSCHLVAQGLPVCRRATIHFADSVQAVVNLSCKSELYSLKIHCGNTWSCASSQGCSPNALNYQMHLNLLCDKGWPDSNPEEEALLPVPLLSLLLSAASLALPSPSLTPSLKLPHPLSVSDAEVLCVSCQTEQRRGWRQAGHGKTWQTEWENGETLGGRAGQR